MAHFLIVDDVDYIRKEWKLLLDEDQHTYVEVENVDQAIKAINESEENDSPFDLILLDHDLGDETGIDVLESCNREYIQYRIVVITGHESTALARKYAQFGVINHLIKPVSVSQFRTAVVATLERRAIHIDEKENWESAYKLLQEIGLIESVERLQADSTKLIEQYDTLKVTYESLLSDLERAGSRENEISHAYRKATETLNSASIDINSILPFLSKFEFTNSFWQDIESIFFSDRLHFFLLQSYLKKISENPLAYRIKHLTGRARDHYEYRVGKGYRLYFRREGSLVILERFGNKNVQEKIINFLSGNLEDFVVNGVNARNE